MTDQQPTIIVPAVDCGVCADLDKQLEAARAEWDYSAETDVRVQRRLHRDAGLCGRVQ